MFGDDGHLVFLRGLSGLDELLAGQTEALADMLLFGGQGYRAGLVARRGRAAGLGAGQSPHGGWAAR